VWRDLEILALIMIGMLWVVLRVELNEPQRLIPVVCIVTVLEWIITLEPMGCGK
jgi:hypothetical protein